MALPRDVRIRHVGPAFADVNVINAKTGPLQFVPIKDVAFIKRLSAFALAQRSDRSTRLFSLSYAKYSARLKHVAIHFGLDPSLFTTHCARNGGTLRDYCNGASAETISMTGRWAAVSSLRQYLTNERSWILKLPVLPERHSPSFSPGFPSY